MTHIVDARGLLCPLPLLRARAALASLGSDAARVVLATDPEAPIDLTALAADEGHAIARERLGDGWQITLTKSGAGR